MYTETKGDWCIHTGRISINYLEVTMFLKKLSNEVVRVKPVTDEQIFCPM
jgi:hypothetical protein